jgi:predicted kinase
MQLIDLFTTYKAKVSIIYIEVPHQHLHHQNKNRDAMVPATALDKLTHKLEVPALWEAHAVKYK